MQKQAQSRAGMGAGDFPLGVRVELSLAGQAVSACTWRLTAAHDAEGKDSLVWEGRPWWMLRLLLLSSEI